MNKRLFKLILFIIGVLFFFNNNFIGAESQKDNVSLKEALFYRVIDEDEGTVQCMLCPRKCVISKGQTGFCRARKNINGKLYSRVYGKVVSAHVDPIEKKPLFHFLPSSNAFSIATAGCNFRCKFCQNWQISQRDPNDVSYVYLSPEEVVNKAVSLGSETIAFTYNEPITFYEYMLDIAKLAKKEGIKTLMITNGYINEKPLRKLTKYIDAANVDLKGFTEEFYENVVFGNLNPVLRTLKIMKEESVWLEVTNLIIPTLNDDPDDIKRMCEWIKENLGTNVPLHFSRFSPMYKLTNLPYTSVDTLEKAVSIAKEVGLKYVYLGNVPGHDCNSTFCPKCGRKLIHRVGFQVLTNNIIDGKCKFCGHEISGVWK